MNRATFQSFVTNFAAPPTFASLMRKSSPGFVSLATKIRIASAPCFLIRGHGSITFPIVRCIACPRVSRPRPWMNTRWNGLDRRAVDPIGDKLPVPGRPELHLGREPTEVVADLELLQVPRVG